MKPSVSVVIPAYNAERTLGEALKSLGMQTGCAPFETIVVDNNSTDRTAEIARAAGAIVLHESIRGPAAARNCGLRAAAGSVIAHMDADTVPSRRWLAELCEPFTDGATVIAAGNTLCYPPETGAERYVQSIGLYDAQLASKRSPFPFAPSLNLAVRKDAALAIGGWSQDLITGEDVDFSYRLMQRYPAHIVYAPRAVLYHHARADDAALRRQARSYGAGVADLYRRYPQEVDWNFARSVHLARLLATRIVAPVIATLGKRLGVIDAKRAEFLTYQSLWTRQFWIGFAQRAMGHPWERLT